MYSRRDFSRFGLTLAGGVAALKAASGIAAEAATEKFEVTKSDDEWKKELTPEQFDVLRKQGTERAGTSPLDANYAAGSYLCAGCALALFSSETKFHSGTGWLWARAGLLPAARSFVASSSGSGMPSRNPCP